MTIRSHLQARLGERPTLPIVDTVERVQGQTVELVAISACASDRQYVSGLAGFLLSPNRLNVAASRARTKVVLTADPTVMEEIPTEYDALLAQKVWREFLDLAEVVEYDAA
jgi:superfamily I DNA and/or RNA helicase